MATTYATEDDRTLRVDREWCGCVVRTCQCGECVEPDRDATACVGPHRREG